MQKGQVLSVNASATHSMRKAQKDAVKLLKGLGVEGDAHMGKTIKHRSRVAKDPNQPNLRQVHLIQGELHEELHLKGFAVQPGEMGENITTTGIELLELPRDTILKIGESAQIKITGLRNPCKQLNGVAEGLLYAVTAKDESGNVVLKSGIMAVVEEGGIIKPGDAIIAILPEKPYVPLEKV